MLSRRELVSKLAVGAAGAGVVLAARLGRANAALARGDAHTPTGSEHGAERPAPAAEAPGAQAPAHEMIVIDSTPPATLSAPPPWELLHPLRLGSEAAHGWRVAELTGAVDGTCVLTLRNERGRTHRVHLCRNAGRPQGLVYTERFDLVVMNGGQGDLPTEECLAQAVAEVAHVLAANEHDWRKEPLVAALLPQEERVRRFTGSMDRRLR